MPRALSSAKHVDYSRHFASIVWRVVGLFKSTGHRVCASKPGRSVVGLSRGFVACRQHLISTPFTSRSVLSGPPQSSMPLRMPYCSFPYCESLLQRWFRSVAGQWFASRRSRLLVYVFTLRLLSIETPCLYISELLLAAQDHKATRTAIMRWLVYSGNGS